MAEIVLPGLAGLERVEVAGRGTSGSVFRAFQPRFDRWVAVKVLVQAVDAEAAERFARECRALGGLSGHPYVVGVHDAGFLTDGRPYLVMPFLVGGSLADGVRARGPLPAGGALDIGVKIASALAAAHGLGVLHRDVKPDNILLTQYGEPQLADFGIARLEAGGLTRTGTYAGTPLHAAPEVLAGGRATVASDVYGLVSTLYALVAGQAAFHAATDESIFPLLQRITSEPPPDLRARGLPDALVAVIERGMAKAPGARPDSAQALGRELQQAQRVLGLAPSSAPGLTAAGLSQPPPPQPPPPQSPTPPPDASAASQPSPQRLPRLPPLLAPPLTGQLSDSLLGLLPTPPPVPAAPPTSAAQPAPLPGQLAPSPAQPSPGQPASAPAQPVPAGAGRAAPGPRSRRPLLIGASVLVLAAAAVGIVARTRGSSPGARVPSGPHTYTLDAGTPSTAVLAVGDGSPGVDDDVLLGPQGMSFALLPVGSATRSARRLTLPLAAATVRTGGTGGLMVTLTGADGAGFELRTTGADPRVVSSSTLELDTVGAASPAPATTDPTACPVDLVLTQPTLLSVSATQVHLTATVSLTACGAAEYGQFLGDGVVAAGSRLAGLDVVLHVRS